MIDQILSATTPDGNVRAFAASTRTLTEELRRRHDASRVASAALGRLACGALLLATREKEQARVTVQVHGGGPLGELVADADSAGNVRAYAQDPQVELPARTTDGKLDVGRAVGQEGYLNVVMQVAEDPPYQGMVPLVSGELGDDFTYYLAQSQQLTAAVGLGVLVGPEGVRRAGGFLVEVLPFTPPAQVQALQRRIEGLKSVTELLMQHDSPLFLLEQVLGVSPTHTVAHAVRFSCPCSKERFGRGLIALGPDELQALADRGEEAELVCHFCGEKYYYSVEDLRALRQQALGEGR
ncbi:MAG: Hsp33 family molecular chaperone HslO [Firmicutes bacterium]|nr:Hsp33 family molecular chaperone HslO [Bacillota bacterium]